MPFREKSAWASLVSMLIVYGTYFTILAPRLAATQPRPTSFLPLLIACVVALIILQIVLHTVLAIAMRREANLPPDEREHLIGLKSDRVALGVLTTLVAAGWLLYLGGPAFMTDSGILANLVLLALVIAAAAKYVSQIVYFHRRA